PRLHVEHARPPEAAFGAPEGHRPERPHGPDGVGVSEREYLAFFAARPRQLEFANQGAGAGEARARHAGDGFDQQSHEPLQFNRRVGWRFAFHELANLRDQGRLIAARPNEERVSLWTLLTHGAT